MGEAPWRQYQCSRRAGRLHLTIAIIACLDVAMWITLLWDIIVCCHPKFVMGAHQSFFEGRSECELCICAGSLTRGGDEKAAADKQNLIRQQSFKHWPLTLSLVLLGSLHVGDQWSPFQISEWTLNTEQSTPHICHFCYIWIYIYELRPKGTVRPRYPGTTPII